MVDPPLEPGKITRQQESSRSESCSNTSRYGLPNRFIINPYSKRKTTNQFPHVTESVGTPSRIITTNHVTPSPPRKIHNPYTRRNMVQQDNNTQQSTRSPQQSRVCLDCGSPTGADWKSRCLSCWGTWKDNNKNTDGAKRRLDYGDITDDIGRDDRKMRKTQAEV